MGVIRHLVESGTESELVWLLRYVLVVSGFFEW
jgi:hypothetical protein